MATAHQRIRRSVTLMRVVHAMPPTAGEHRTEREMNRTDAGTQ
jgi:hypothetical protein